MFEIPEYFEVSLVDIELAEQADPRTESFFMDMGDFILQEILSDGTMEYDAPA